MSKYSEGLESQYKTLGAIKKASKGLKKCVKCKKNYVMHDEKYCVVCKLK